jgi:hypothetical protein
MPPEQRGRTSAVLLREVRAGPFLPRMPSVRMYMERPNVDTSEEVSRR